ncbi:MAG TPA: protein-L-isoaspartate(D-aspartate) O-methyltransferase [Solirubrobacteraceae bacterium]|nr:protein-L-isoaspartate(D-aspartate) O-methyltransferase [Solirubrobacteraceae bacterium]
MPADGRELARALRASVRDERVLRAIASVPRDLFVPPELHASAWADCALPIAADQTISQPTVVARMCELLTLTGAETVLDVGTGSGYHAAVLSRLVTHVYSIERHPELTEDARRALARAGIRNVTLVSGDGTRGHPEAAPYGAINVAARAAQVPPALLEQLAVGGRLVIPLTEGEQHLVRLRRTHGGVVEERFERVSFVPLVRD